jgi:hypothetical protein
VSDEALFSTMKNRRLMSRPSTTTAEISIVALALLSLSLTLIAIAL